jgi:3-dehydroquinate dehydratase-1
MDFDSFVLAASVVDLDDETRAREYADAVEFRMDRYAARMGRDPLDALEGYDGELAIIATNRAAWEGGEAEDDDARLDALAEAAALDAVEAVDVELRTITDGEGGRVVEVAREHDATAIASVHDFEATPSRAEMADLLVSAEARADVGKLAVTAVDTGDVLDLLATTWTATRAGHRVATMAMGEAGRHSRAVAPLYGSKIGYAPVDPERATAPGQYDLATLAGLVATLE